MSVATTLSPRVQVSEMQRSRLLAAAVLTVEEVGWSGASVAHITSRARVSRRTFYGLFDNREDCLLAVLNDVVERVERELEAASLDGLSWRERVRTGLWTILCFLDREPALARVCVVQALRGGPRALARREQILARLAGVVDEGPGDGRRRACPPLIAEGLVGAVFAIVYSRLRLSPALVLPAGRGGASRSRTQGAWRTTYAGDRGRRDTLPLVTLLPDLMGMIVLPYLGAGAADRERRGAGKYSSGRAKRQARAADFSPGDPLAGMPMRLTYRTARVLETIAARPGVSNRAVGELAGVTDQGQISKLLARLERLGLAAKSDGRAKGEPNAWRLTPLGERVAQQLSLGPPLQEDAA